MREVGAGGERGEHGWGGRRAGSRSGLRRPSHSRTLPARAPHAPPAACHTRRRSEYLIGTPHHMLHGLGQSRYSEHSHASECRLSNGRCQCRHIGGEVNYPDIGRLRICRWWFHLAPDFGHFRTDRVATPRVVQLHGVGAADRGGGQRSARLGGQDVHRVCGHSAG